MKDNVKDVVQVIALLSFFIPAWPAGIIASMIFGFSSVTDLSDAANDGEGWVLIPFTLLFGLIFCVFGWCWARIFKIRKIL